MGEVVVPLRKAQGICPQGYGVNTSCYAPLSPGCSPGTVLAPPLTRGETEAQRGGCALACKVGGVAFRLGSLPLLS